MTFEYHDVLPLYDYTIIILTTKFQNCPENVSDFKNKNYIHTFTDVTLVFFFEGARFQAGHTTNKK